MAEKFGLIAELSPEVSSSDARKARDRVEKEVTGSPIELGVEVDQQSLRKAQQKTLGEKAVQAKDRATAKGAEVLKSGAKRGGRAAKGAGKFGAHFAASKVLSELGLPVNVPSTSLPGLPDIGKGGGSDGGGGAPTGGSDGTSAMEPDEVVPLLQEQLGVQEEMLEVLEDIEENTAGGSGSGGGDTNIRRRIQNKFGGSGGAGGAAAVLGGGAAAGVGALGLASIVGMGKGQGMPGLPEAESEQGSEGDSGGDGSGEGVPASDIIGSVSLAALLNPATMPVAGIITGSVAISDYVTGEISLADNVTGGISASDIIKGTAAASAIVAGSVTAASLISGTIAISDYITDGSSGGSGSEQSTGSGDTSESGSSSGGGWFMGDDDGAWYDGPDPAGLGDDGGTITAGALGGGAIAGGLAGLAKFGGGGGLLSGGASVGGAALSSAALPGAAVLGTATGMHGLNDVASGGDGFGPVNEAGQDFQKNNPDMGKQIYDLFTNNPVHTAGQKTGEWIQGGDGNGDGPSQRRNRASENGQQQSADLTVEQTIQVDPSDRNSLGRMVDSKIQEALQQFERDLQRGSRRSARL